MIEAIKASYQEMPWIELIAVLSGVLYLILAAYENIWCWFWSLLSVVLYMYILSNAKLWAETGLQFYYLGTTAYGFYVWKFGGRNKAEKLIEKLNIREHFLFSGLIVFGALGLGSFLHFNTDASMPFVDSFTTIGAIVVTYMVTRKYLENWLYWIVVDGVGVYMYWSKELYLTALLFLAYTIMVVFGYFKWLRDYRNQVSNK
ncbi:nicotinamide riboside transporter PnuC [Salibacter sp.]|uniref:nicotinamide riboside transporter PnuC n=1 Tax=Salibacter sp. TaxID=2010995 RepID=UPI00286FF858|nr:nicotinamide riboside transporter PnuC [Salibacter sp.]MDR9488600.1 nicotinamide riboside transporter PnuC [Salibacter sp.]